MTALGLHPPLMIEALEESVKVVDRAGVVAAYVYVSDDPDRRQQTRRLTSAEGIEVARVIARALTDRLETEQPPRRART